MNDDIAQVDEHPLAKFGVVLDNKAPAEHMAELADAVRSWTGDGADIAACLPVVLVGLNWKGHARDLADALPPQGDVFDITALRNLMGRFGFSSRVENRSVSKSNDRFPAIVLTKDGNVIVALALGNGATAEVYDVRTASTMVLPLSSLRGQVITFDVLVSTESPRDFGWYRRQIPRFRQLLTHAFLMTGLSNLLALSVPLFVLLVYDRVIAAGSLKTLASVAVGVGLALMTDIVVRRVRRRLINFASTRIGVLSASAVFDRLLSLPIAMTERASIGAQVARLRDLERVKEFIAGPLGLAVLDMPFVVIFVAAIAVIAGWLAVIPVFAAALYIIGGIALSRTVARNVELAAKLNSQRQEMLIEFVQRLRAIRAAGSTETWIDRFTDISSRCALHNARNSRTTALVTVISQSLMLGAGLATLGFGVNLAIAGTLSSGGLIAAMILVWRAMAPMQGLFVFLTRIDQLRNSITQTNRLLELPPERGGGLPMAAPRGHVELSNVTFRYPGEADPAVSNVSLEANPGQVTAIIGKNGSGKSSVLKLIAGLYTPLAGSIRIDGRDIRQIDLRELRQMIAYVSQTPNFFNGTITENLRMSNPLASADEINSALEMAGAWDEVAALPDKLETFLHVRQTEQFSTSFMMRLSLARAYLRKAPIVLMDEPITGLDFEAEFHFTAAIDELRQSATVFVVTHRPSHLRTANNVLILEAGQVRYFGSAADVRDKIPVDLI